MQNQNKITIQGREFLPLYLKDYPLIFELLDVNLINLSNLPDNLLERILLLVSDKALKPIDNAPDLLQAVYQYVLHHVNLLQKHERILSYEEQQDQQELEYLAQLEASGDVDQAKKLRGEIKQATAKKRFNSRRYNRQLKELKQQVGEYELSLINWTTAIANSNTTNLSAAELLELEYPEFIKISNSYQILQNLSAASSEDHQAQIELEQSKMNPPQPPMF